MSAGKEGMGEREGCETFLSLSKNHEPSMQPNKTSMSFFWESREHRRRLWGVCVLLRRGGAVATTRGERPPPTA